MIIENGFWPFLLVLYPIFSFPFFIDSQTEDTTKD
jgi:hypothetical protein